MTGLCESRPEHWWDMGDDGNRLALLLCRVCPALVRCRATSGREVDVVRAGVPYGERGQVLPLCPCGYPNRHRTGGGHTPNPLCHRCAVPPWPRRWSGRREYWRRYYLSRRAA